MVDNIVSYSILVEAVVFVFYVIDTVIVVLLEVTGEIMVLLVGLESMPQGTGLCCSRMTHQDSAGQR